MPLCVNCAFQSYCFSSGGIKINTEMSPGNRKTKATCHPSNLVPSMLTGEVTASYYSHVVFLFIFEECVTAVRGDRP